MSTAHTPGPWINKHWGRGPYIDIGATAWHSDSAQDYMVRVHPRYSAADGVGATAIAEAEANARLISAAPDLLAACQALLAVSLPSDVSGQRFIDQARAAIAKATGWPE